MMMSYDIDTQNTDDILVATCRTMIKTILSCLDNATRGTIYKIGLMPELIAMRVLSGARKQSSDELDWSLPAISEYNPPGKKWEHYRDQPGRPLEAMGWCVEKQISWTADNPVADPRSVRKQLSGEPEDEFHMEPVLVPKKSLYGYSLESIQYPSDSQGNAIWQESEYAVSAIIKIHFERGTLKRGDRSTRIIRDLAQSLGSELLSLRFREKLRQASKDFARQRLQTSEILAHELRNTLVKLGFVFSTINAQIGILRECWEDMLRKHVPGLEWKRDILEVLCGVLSEKCHELQSSRELHETGQKLLHEQKELAGLSLSPHQEQAWVKKKISPKWKILLRETCFWDRSEINSMLDRLSKALRTGMDFDFSVKLDGLPLELLGRWSKLAYLEITSGNILQLDEVIRLVEHPALPINHREQMLKVLKSSSALLLTIPELEEKTTRILQSLRSGTWAEDSCRFDYGLPDSECDRKFGMFLAN